MENKKDFWSAIPEDCQKAISELKRLKVFGCCGFDFEEDFSDVWWLVLREVDLYVDDMFRIEEGGLTKKQAQKAEEWLIMYLPLFNKYKNIKPGRYNDADFLYERRVK